MKKNNTDQKHKMTFEETKKTGWRLPGVPHISERLDYLKKKKKGNEDLISEGLSDSQAVINKAGP